MKYHQNLVLSRIVNHNILPTININLKTCIMEKIQAIKPGPKPKKPDGTDDRRQRVDPANKPKHPDLKPHIHKPND